MTSARAYRPARAQTDAIAELRHHSFTQFDHASVEALLAALPLATEEPEPALQELLGRQLA
jgi:HD-GYP domain-containing protein (c-di-GMP phosphodiesterase class II)